MEHRLGTVIDTPAGPAAITGCDRWPVTGGPNVVHTNARGSAVNDAGDVVLLVLKVDGWAVAA